jgi:hypothetical protein
MLNSKVKTICLSLQFIVLLFSQSDGFSQSGGDESKNIFAQAESYYLYEEYELANQLFLLIETSDNMNIKYKIGSCYINIASEKEKAIPYLEEAVKTATYDSKTESYKETRAPLDAYFFLAKAYMINNEYEKALSTLNVFSTLVKESKAGMENLNYVEQLIQASKNAIQFRQVPVDFGKASLGKDINGGALNENPAISYDGNTIVYTEKRGVVNVIFFSKKVRGEWQMPIDITKELKAGDDASSCSLNSDGTVLFLYKTDNYDGSLYSSDYVNGAWTPIKKLNKNINTKFYESHAAISYDGKKLFFTSNREGGFGNLDIYVSELQGNDWGPAVNLGSEINTPYNEDTPFITQNDSLLYFCSEGHNSMGGYDIFKSRKTENGWKTPNNLGYPINSADDDKFFQPNNNGDNAFYTLTTDYKKRDIFCLDFKNAGVKLNYKIAGTIHLNDTSLIPGKNYSVKIVDKVSGDTLCKTLASESTGLYSLNVSSGVFKVLYSAEGYFTKGIDTIIVQNNPEPALNIDVTLYKDTISGREPIIYEKINLANIPQISSVDTSILIKNLIVKDATDKNADNTEVLYYTVQVIALHKPVDVTYFKYINDMKVMYNDDDKFYRYTTGMFPSKEEAFSLRTQLIAKGYPDQIFVKKVSQIKGDN